ncbi:hypothetical protein [Emcibacter nanhaiensis]|uniref:Glycerophosphoryl diester phosphodiesterase membrane domain-containing protein n=1 Tax=Emcibacter nanhaiensis TaxID=1505037 RepID=A0A501PMA7_9PROT|nr:hypothetical protein [Emcibacter nanhaiensis]TPD61563.1 hypothetical protein FIV46_04965 [Emcibacter nanhaiensis]
MSKRAFQVGSSIAESYNFFLNHLPHFFRLVTGPFILWIFFKGLEKILIHEYGIKFDTTYVVSLFTASFALVWYRQFLLGAQHASYTRLVAQGFQGGNFSLLRLGRSVLRIVVIAAALVVPTIVLSIIALLLFNGAGEPMTKKELHELVFKCTVVVMVLVSPLLVRFSLLSAATALGRRNMRLRHIWQKTSGFTFALWMMTFRAFLPISLYAWVLSWMLKEIVANVEMHYLWAVLVVNVPASLMTFFMLAIVVAANAEAFRVLIGVREGDAPHRADAGKPRTENVAREAH